MDTTAPTPTASEQEGQTLTLEEREAILLLLGSQGAAQEANEKPSPKASARKTRNEPEAEGPRTLDIPFDAEPGGKPFESDPGTGPMPSSPE